VLPHSVTIDVVCVCVCVSCDNNVGVIDDESVDNVADFSLIVRCRWRSSARRRDDVRGYIVTVECQQSDTSADTATLSLSLVDMVTMAVQSVNKCLSVRGVKNCRTIGGLRVFARTDCFSTAGLCQG